jgi:hypothetical protein
METIYGLHLPYYYWDDGAMKVGAGTAIPFFLLPGAFLL